MARTLHAPPPSFTRSGFVDVLQGCSLDVGDVRGVMSGLALRAYLLSSFVILLA